MGPDLVLQQERFGDDGIGVEVIVGVVFLAFVGFLISVGYDTFSQAMELLS